jgi:hypothetical protein
MQQNLPHSLEKKITLPLIDLLDRTELAFSHAFLQAAHTLHTYLQEIESSIASAIDSDTEPFAVATIGLFSKLIRNYYSYILLEIHCDRVGSQFLIEELCHTAVTLVYLLETADREFVTDYISVSIDQARILLQEVETQLLQASNRELLELRDRLKTFIAAQKQPGSDRQLTDLAAGMQSREIVNTIDRHAASLGLDFLSNPARQIARKITPASWLDVQLNYGHSVTSNWQVQKIDFQQLRDASHLCLHATKTLLSEVPQILDDGQAEIQRQPDLNRFFEWFYQAYQAYSGGSDASLKSHKNCGYG